MSFRCDDGQDWEVVLWPSPACGGGYADIRRVSDGKLSVRPISYLQAAGISYTELLDPGFEVGYAEPAPVETASAGRFVLVSGENTYVTSWDEWADAEAAAWPVPEGHRIEDTWAGKRLVAGATAWLDIVVTSA